MNSSSPLLRIASLIALLPFAAFGQGSVIIYGTVTDPGGASIYSAIITLESKDTGQTRELKFGRDGSFEFPGLPVGSYNLIAKATGFKTFLEDNIAVQVDENRRVPVRMALGDVSESVTVAAEVAQVETRSGSLKEVIDSARIIELPLNGRNPLQLQYLVAGSGGIIAAGQAENESVSINGSRANSNNYQLDGADNHDPFFNTPSVFPNPDALDEFSLQTSAYGADQGRNAGAVMNAITKSGTNKFHGTAFEFLRNQKLDARSYFAATLSPFRRNQFGGTFGGPIRKDRTFFFGSYQGTQTSSSPGTQNPLVLTALQRTGDFSTLAKPLKDPLGGTFAGNLIPASRISQASLNFLSGFVPLPNTPSGFYSYAGQQTTVDDQAVVKIDHRISTANQISGRLLYERDKTNQVVSNTTLPGFLALIDYKNWNVSISDSHTFSGNLINIFTFGFNHITREQLPQTPVQKTWGDFGAGFIRSAPGPIAYDTQVAAAFSAQSRYLLDQFRKGYQFSDGITWVLGRHSLKIGGDLRPSLVDQGQNFETDPQVLFTSNYTGNSLADFLIGRPNSFTENSPNSGKPRTTEADAYLQDDWKASQKLTLNLGLRWDPFLPFDDLTHALSQVRLGQQSTVYPTAPLGYVFPGDKGVPSSTVRVRWAQFAPRFGFAWDVFGTGSTSVRGGYGLFFSDIRQQALNNLSLNQPFSTSLTVTQPSGGLAAPYSDTGNPFPFQPPTSAQERQTFKFSLPLGTVTEFDPDFHGAKVQQWNVSVQRQLFSSWVITAAYAGSAADHLFIQNQLNPAIYGKPGSTVNARRLLAPTYTSILDMLSVANSFYNSLQITANRRFHHGFTILANYTWSKSIDDGSADGYQAANPFNIRSSRGLSDFNIPQRFVASSIWQIPGVKGYGRLLREIADGWEVNGIFTAQSGSPFSVTSGVDNSQSGIGADRANLVGNPTFSGDRSRNQMLAQYFNTAAFVVNPLGTFGNAGRNILRGPHSVNLDFGVIKSFNPVERVRLQLRAEAFNFANHANFGNPNANVSSSTFGLISGSASPRVVQVAAKVVF